MTELFSRVDAEIDVELDAGCGTSGDAEADRFLRPLRSSDLAWRTSNQGRGGGPDRVRGRARGDRRQGSRGPARRRYREWISYLRVSTVEQAERDLSLPGQRRAVEEYAARHGVVIAREYLEAGCSGTSSHRKAFRQMLEDVFRPNSTVSTVVVHHTSRFTRDSTEARLVKQRFRKVGVRMGSVCQETSDDPIGNLIEGIFECIDQYESEMNGMRTSLAMREAVRQGYFPSSWTPFGFRRVRQEIRPGVVRWYLELDEHEAEIVRQLFMAYVAGSGAKRVAHSLNERGLLYRRDRLWTRNLVLHILDEPAVAGTYHWGRWSTKRKIRKHESEWLSLSVTPIVNPAVHQLAMKLRAQRQPSQNPGSPASPTNLLARVVRRGKCGASYQRETSGKRTRGGVYRYCYYNCSRFCRIGTTACSRPCSGMLPGRAAEYAHLDVFDFLGLRFP